MRPAVVLLLLLSLTFLVACAQRTPAPMPTSSATTLAGPVTLATVLDAPQEWSGRTFTLVSPVRSNDDARLLVRRLRAEPAADDVTDAIWLADPLPNDIRAALPSGRGVLELHGQLSPSGAYGPDQRFPYQFNAETISMLQPERSTIANLALNPRALDGIVLRLEGALLTRSSEALLVDEVSAGGVPTAAARQIKLDPADVDPYVIAELNRSGDVRWGPVVVVGWWQNGALLPFAIEPLTTSNRAGSPEPEATVQP